VSKRYIFFVGTLSSGGAERVISILSKQMVEEDLEVEILTYYDRPVFYELSPKVKYTTVEGSTHKHNKIYNLLWIRKYFKKNARVVISFLAPFNIMAIMANMGTKIPIIVADRNDPQKVPGNLIIRKLRDFLYMFADDVVVQTEKNKLYFNKSVQNKSCVIYNPVNLGENAGDALKVCKETKIVTAGRLMPQKNQKMLIEAFSEVLQKHPEYKLILYGEGPSREELESLIKRLNIEENVFMPGSTTTLHDEIKNAEIFVLSSDYEGMPNALIEAMCLGVPVISTKVSGATDLIENRENGLLVEVGKCEELKKAMLEFIENKKFAEKCAEKAIKLNEKLEVTRITKQWIDVIGKW